MKLLRLLCAFENVSPANTKIILKNGKGCAVWSGRWNDMDAEKYYRLDVLDFEIDKLSAANAVQTMTVTVAEA